MSSVQKRKARSEQPTAKRGRTSERDADDSPSVAGEYKARSGKTTVDTVKRSKAGKAEATFQLRLTVADRDTISAAAAALNLTRSEFVLSAARERAVETLLDQRFFQLTGDSARTFAEALDSPPEPNEALRKLASERKPWE